MLFVLIHSPLVGPYTWRFVAQELRARNREVLVSTLSGPILEPSAETQRDGGPYLQQFAPAVAGELVTVPRNRLLCLIGHSGAGPQLPAIRNAIAQPVACYVYVDAGIPCDGASYLDLLASELPDQVDAFRQMLQAGGRYPNWDESMLEALIPDPQRRRRMLAELQPRPLAYFEEPIPVFAGWPDAPCFYLQLSAAYDFSAAQAREMGWPVHIMDAGHFHMLVEPEAVTDAILQLVQDSELL